MAAMVENVRKNFAGLKKGIVMVFEQKYRGLGQGSGFTRGNLAIDRGVL